MAESRYEPLLKTPVTQSGFTDQEILDLASKFSTPLYLINETTLRDKVTRLENAFSAFRGTVRVAYSMKANFSPAVIRVFKSEGILFDLTSLGELTFYLKCGGLPENVVYTSVTEEMHEFKEVLSAGVSIIAVSSYNGLLNLIEASNTLNSKPRIIIRVNPEVGVKAEVKASYRHGKFGVPFNTQTLDSATSLLRKIISSNLTFEGFHFHLGSQIEDPVCFINALEKLGNFVHKMRKEFPDLPVKTIDIGGGTPVFYGENVPTPEEIGSLLVGKLNALADYIGDQFTLIVESGRYLCAEACVLISKVVNTKVYGEQKFVLVDAGYHLLLDSALLHQQYPQEVVPKSDTMETRKIHLAGRLCDTYDIFPVSQVSNLAGAETGKYVVFKNVGAYSIVFNMPFHCQTKPAIVMKRNTGEFVQVRKSQTVDQLFEEEGGSLTLENQAI